MIQFLQDNWLILLVIVGMIAILLEVVIRVVPLVKRKHREKKNRKRMIRYDMIDIDKLDEKQFEAYVQVVFFKMGYHSEMTPNSHRFGADFILTEKGANKNKIAVRAAKQEFGHKVSVDAIQEVYAAQAHYKAKEAWVITNSLFTKRGMDLAESCNVRLLDRDELQDFIYRNNPDMSVAEFSEIWESES